MQGQHAQREVLDFTHTPDTMLLPDMLYTFEVVDMQIVRSKSDKSLVECPVCSRREGKKVSVGKKMIMLTYEVLEPDEFKGSQLTENFVVGTQTDPCVHDPLTLSKRNYGNVLFKQLLKTTNTPENDGWKILHKRFQAFVLTTLSEVDGEKRPQNSLSTRKYPVGTALPGQQTPEKVYPKGKERYETEGDSFNGVQINSSPSEMEKVNCPRCKAEFAIDEIDDHLVACNA